MRSVCCDVGCVARQGLQLIKADPDVRVALIRGEGRAFTAGLDLAEASGALSGHPGSPAEGAAAFLRTVTAYQRPFLTLTTMLKPVIACVHGYCIGGGVDLSAACDVRYASKDATFSVREIKIGMVRDGVQGSGANEIDADVSHLSTGC